MNDQLPNHSSIVLAQALSEIRDAWVSISLVLKDHVADFPSSERDELMIHISLQLERIREAVRDSQVKGDVRK